MAKYTKAPWALQYNPGQKGQPATWIMQAGAQIHEKVIAECPWGQDGNTDGPDGDGLRDCTALEAQANAAHIVRCVNSHAALVEACRAARLQVRDGTAIANQLDAALKFAGETP